MLQQMFELTGRRIWVAGHRGMVGAALVRRLEREKCEVLTVGRGSVDLRRQSEVEGWMSNARPEVVLVAAGTVGGIVANNSRPAEFLYDNLTIESNIIHSSKETRVEKLLFLGSTCIYPRLAAQPISEEALLTGALEPTNVWYAVAKIAGIKLCDAYRRQYGCRFISAQPTNLYGPEDNFDLQSSHVLPALMHKIHKAKQSGANKVEIWGTGTPKREFMCVDDLADALVFLLRHYDQEGHVNVGTGEEVTVGELAERIAAIIGYEGDFVFANDKPDGAPRKLVDVTRLKALGWRAQIKLEVGLRRTYDWYIDHGPGSSGSCIGMDHSLSPELVRNRV